MWTALQRRTAKPSWAALLLLAACGGGGGGGGNGGGDGGLPASPVPVPVAPPPPGVVASATSPVAAGCTGGRSSGTVYVDAEAEPWVTVSPLDANHLVGVWQQDRASDGGARALVSAVSTDGGRSWVRSLLPLSRCGGAAPGTPGDHERVSDPWVDFGADGTVYLMGLAFSGNSFAADAANQMLVLRSTDGGRHWGPPTSLQRDQSQAFNDKNSLTADPTDARYVYAVWDRLDGASNGPTLLARSIDGGLSWLPAQAIYSPAVAGGVSQTLGNRIVVIGDGAERGVLVNAFTQIDSVAGRSSSTLRVQRSSDHGATWSAPVWVADLLPVGTTDPATGLAVRDGALIPSVASGGGGVLWLAWQDARFSGGARDAIAVSRSGDGGRSWSAPLAVNHDPAVAAFTPTLRVRADGSVGLMHFDLRSNTSDASTLLADLWLLTSRDGLTWTETAVTRGFDLARVPTVTGGYFLGDYQGLASAGNTWLPLVVLPGNSAANRSDVYAMRLEAGAAAAQAGATVHAARAEIAQALATGHASFSQSRSAAIGRAMGWRIPGWAQRVEGGQPGAPPPGQPAQAGAR